MNLSDINLKGALYNGTASQTQGTREQVHSGDVKQTLAGYRKETGIAITSGADAAVEKALDEAGIPKNQRNTEIARQMLDNRMPLDANSLRKIISQVNMFREADISTLLLMNKNEMPVDRFTVSQFQSYLNNEQQLSMQLQDAAAALSEMLSSEAAESGLELNLAVLNLLAEAGAGEGPAAEGTASDILKGMSGSSEIIPGVSESDVTVNSDSVSTTEIADGTDALQNAAISGKMPDSAIKNLVSTPGNNINIGAQGVAAAGLSGSNLNASEVLAQNIAAGADGVSFATMNDVGNDVDGSGTDVFNGFASDSGTMNGEQLGTETSGTEMGEGAAKGDILSRKDSLILSSVFTENELADFEEVIRSFVLDSEGIGEKSVEGALEKLHASISNASDEELDKLFSDTSYQKLINTALAEKLSLNLEDLQNADTLNRYYRDTFKTLTKLHELASDNEKVANALEKPMDNVRFMDTINNVFPYIQLPLKFKDNNTHGELYVFKNGRSKTNVNEVQSVLLHLDMEHLGSTDVHMELKQRTLNMHFYVNDDISRNSLNENYEELKTALEKKGFNVVSEFSVRTEEETTVAMAEAMAIESNAGPAFSYSFDIRA